MGWTGLGVGVAAIGAGATLLLLDGDDSALAIAPWGLGGVAAEVNF